MCASIITGHSGRLCALLQCWGFLLLAGGLLPAVSATAGLDSDPPLPGLARRDQGGIGILKLTPAHVLASSKDIVLGIPTTLVNHAT